MPKDPLRVLRLRWDDLLGPSPRHGRIRLLDPETVPNPGAPRFIGRVRDGGAIPTTGERVFLVSPVTLDGIESEGAGPNPSIDGTRSIPVVVVGSRAPKAGDLIVVHSCGGRWISEVGGPPETVACGGCEAPRQNLTLSWANTILGAHSSTLTFDGADAWTTGCVNQIVFRLACKTDAVTFSASYYAGGSCPSGQPTICASTGSSTPGMTLTTRSSDPFLLRFTPTSCPVMTSLGYSTFTITK